MSVVIGEVKTRCLAMSCAGKIECILVGTEIVEREPLRDAPSKIVIAIRNRESA